MTQSKATIAAPPVRPHAGRVHGRARHRVVPDYWRGPDLQPEPPGLRYQRVDRARAGNRTVRDGHASNPICAWPATGAATVVASRLKAVRCLATPTRLGLTVPVGPSVPAATPGRLTWQRPIDGNDNGYTLPCGGQGGAQADSDMITVRRASVQPVAPEAGRLQIQSTRIQGELFENGGVPPAFMPVVNHPITGARRRRPTT